MNANVATPVIIAALNGEILALQDAIVEISHVFDQVNAHERDPSVLVGAVQEAMKLLPADKQKPRLSGTTFWYHPESDCFFTLKDGELDPRSSGTADGALCVEITREEFKAKSLKSFLDNTTKNRADEIVEVEFKEQYGDNQFADLLG